MLFVPSGKWLTRSFNITSHFTLFLHKEAVLLPSQVDGFRFDLMGHIMKHTMVGMAGNLKEFVLTNYEGQETEFRGHSTIDVPKSIPVCDLRYSELIPCLDRNMMSHMKLKLNLSLMEHYESHCPQPERCYNCLILPPLATSLLLALSWDDFKIDFQPLIQVSKLY